MDSSSKVVYLTFDDGPIPEVTPALLDLLQRKQVKATFFMVADNAVKYPDIYQRVLREGHHVGNHTYNHLKGSQLSTALYMDNVAKADAVLQGTRLFRPPYGKMKPSQRKLLLAKGYRIFLWDVLTHDYNKNYSVARMTRIVMRYTRPGSIINFHDSVKSAERTIETVERIVDLLRDKGYEFALL